MIHPTASAPVSARHAMHNLDGRCFRALTNTDNGDVTGQTLFHYRQRGNVVWALYAGGGVRQGTLVATMAPDGALDMRYQHVSEEGALRAGRCQSTPEVLPDGRLRLHERWRWTEGGTGAGVSVVEEVR